MIISKRNNIYIYIHILYIYMFFFYVDEFFMICLFSVAPFDY